MALSTTSSKTTSAKPEDKDPRQPDTTVASETAAQAVVDASPLVPDADRVAMLSIDKDGNPHQSANFRVMVAPDVSDREKAAAHNEAGQALGAQNVKDDR